MNKFYALPLISALTLAVSTAAHADLVIKSGQVIGRDGLIYDGMSPETEAALRAQIKAGETKVGVLNNNLYIMNDDVVTTVPLVQLRGKQSDERLELVKEAYRAELRESLIEDAVAEMAANQLSSQSTELEQQLGNGNDDIERRLEDLDDDIENHLDDHKDVLENQLNEYEREIENHLDEIDHEIEHQLTEHENEIEDHLEGIDDEIENHLSEHESEIESAMESHDSSEDRHSDDHDEHDDD